MCERDGDFVRTGAEFSRGALEAVVEVQNVIVVGTFIEPLDSLPAERCSGNSRLPLPLPCLDVNALMEKVPELKSSPDSLKKANKTQGIVHKPAISFGNKNDFWWLSSSYVLLGMKMTPEEIYLLSDEDTIKKRNSFWRNLNSRSNTLRIWHSQELMLCTSARYPFANFKSSLKPNPTKMLEYCVDRQKMKGLQQAKNLMVLSFSEFSASLTRLLPWKDTKIAVYDQGWDLMTQVLTANTRDLSIDTPLERAFFIWALPCEATLRKELWFGKLKYFEIEPGRIFPVITRKCTNRSLSPKFLLRWQKRRRQNNPSTGWLFFVTFKNELVLIDILIQWRKLMLTKNWKTSRMSSAVTTKTE